MRTKLLSFFGKYWTWNLGQFLWQTFRCSISFQMEGLARRIPWKYQFLCFLESIRNKSEKSLKTIVTKNFTKKWGCVQVFSTAQKMKFFIMDFFSKRDKIRSHLLKKSLMENFIFCAVSLGSFFSFFLFFLNYFTEHI